LFSAKVEKPRAPVQIRQSRHFSLLDSFSKKIGQTPQMARWAAYVFDVCVPGVQCNQYKSINTFCHKVLWNRFVFRSRRAGMPRKSRTVILALASGHQYLDQDGQAAHNAADNGSDQGRHPIEERRREGALPDGSRHLEACKDVLECPGILSERVGLGGAGHDVRFAAAGEKNLSLP
jgi:hypothetical protein